MQSLLVASHRLAWHRRFGLASAFVLVLMLPLGYASTIAMLRRGFDLSGDQRVELNPRPGFLDLFSSSVFNFSSLFIFSLLAASAIYYRRRPAIHKRLMLFANLQLITASIVHLLGHVSLLTGPAVQLFFTPLLLAAVARDYLVEKRVHRLTAALAIVFFLLGPLQAAVIAPSPAWHRVAHWLVRYSLWPPFS